MSDTNVLSYNKMILPQKLADVYNLSESDRAFIVRSREAVSRVIRGEDLKNKIIIVGPCSIHNAEEALEYGRRLKSYIDSGYPAAHNQLIIMRTYFEKPRTRSGWKGLVYDPDLNDSYNVNKGLTICRELLLKLTKMRIPLALEFLDTVTPQYFADLISWGAIGARTTESQVHRQIASGLSMPVGFKNSTSGNVSVAIDAVYSAAIPQVLTGIDPDGVPSVIRTKGNPDCHVILRGGNKGTNYGVSAIERICSSIASTTVNKSLIIDCSHGNSEKDHTRQPLVAKTVNKQICAGNSYIKGIMIESNLNPGNQKLTDDPSKLLPGVSITDSCLGWEQTLEVLKTFVPDPKAKSNVWLEKLDDYRQQLIQMEEPIVEWFADNMKPLPHEHRLYQQRIEISKKIARVKFYPNLRTFLFKDTLILDMVNVKEVEEIILKRVERTTEKFLSNPTEIRTVTRFFGYLFDASKKTQELEIQRLREELTLYYLGPSGSFSDKFVRENLTGKKKMFKSMDDTVDYECYIVLPKYNSVIGKISETERFVNRNLLDEIGELSGQPIKLCLLGNDPEPTTIISHPAAYRQVKDLIEWRHEFIAADSTSSAARETIVINSSSVAAIASQSCSSDLLPVIRHFTPSYTTFALYS